jgi:hypothetical protein
MYAGAARGDLAGLGARLHRLLNSAASTADVALVCGDEPSAPPLPAHRVLLAAASEPLRALIALQLDRPEARGEGVASLFASASDATAVARLPRLVVHGVSARALGALLQFIYTGATPRDAESAIEMLCVAEKFALPGLRAAAELLLPRAIRDDNACAVLVAAAE